MLNGDGLRVVLWVAGCNHCCKECQNPITWDPDGGLLFDESAKQEIFEQLEKPYISGITFSGGDPMHPVNRADVRELMSEIREKYPTNAGRNLDGLSRGQGKGKRCEEIIACASFRGSPGKF